MPYNTAPISPRKEVTGHAQLPLARVKKIISTDSDIAMCSNNAAFVITLATEMFIQNLAEQGYNIVKAEKKPRKNIQYRDLANAVARHDSLEFLSDIVPRTVPLKEVKERAKARAKGLDGALRPGQTTLDGKPLELNGTGPNGFGVESLADDNHDDDSSMADPSAQLQMEIRGMRDNSEDVQPTNGTPHAADHSGMEDVDMS